MSSIKSYKDLSHWPVLTDDELNTIARNTERKEGDKAFHTSSKEPTEILYSESDQQSLIEETAKAFEMAGMTEDDVVLNLGAPDDAEPHLSQWATENSPKEIGEDGAEVVNKSVRDYESIVESTNDVTAVVSLPRATLNIGEAIQSKYGDINEIFPDMRIGIFGGESLTEPVREKLKEQWGFEEVKETYASTETSTAAIENEEGDLVPSNENLYFEILEEGTEVDEETGKAPEDKIHALEDLEEPLTGSLLISAPDRERLPLIRYRMGDIITARPGEDQPILEYEGREGNIINMSGHHMYPNDIEKAVRGVSEGAEWRAIVSEPSDYTELDIYVLDEDIDQGEVVDELFEANKTIGTWYDKGGMEIRQHSLGSMDKLEDELESYNVVDPDKESLLYPKKKTSRVGFDESYDPR